MTELRTYILSLTCAAMICAFTTALCGSRSVSSGMIRFLSGLFLTVTVISPLVKLKPDFSSQRLNAVMEAGTRIGLKGQEQAREEMQKIIKEELEAYIANRAADMGAAVKVNVRISDTDGMPESVYLSGRASPYARRALKNEISRQLGISEENQKWN